MALDPTSENLSKVTQELKESNKRLATASSALGQAAQGLGGVGQQIGKDLAGATGLDKIAGQLGSLPFAGLAKTLGAFGMNKLKQKREDKLLADQLGLSREQVENLRKEKELIEAKKEQEEKFTSAIEALGITSERLGELQSGKSGGAEQREKDFEAGKRQEEQTSLLESMNDNIMGMKNGLEKGFDALKDKAGTGLGALVGIVAAPVIAAMAFFKELSTQFQALKQFKGGAIVRGFQAVKRFLTFWTETFFGPAIRFVKDFGKGSGITKGFGVISKAVSSITGFFSRIIAGIKAMMGPIVNAAKASASFMKGFSGVAKFASIFGKILGKIFFPITIIMSLWDFFKGFSETEGDILDKIGGGLGQLVKGLIGMPLDLIKSAISWVMGALGFEQAEAWLDSFSIGDMLAGFVKTAFEVLTYPITYVQKLLGNIWDGIKGVFGGIWDVIAGIFTGDFSRIGDGIMSIFGGVWDLVTAPFKSIFDTIADIFDFDWMGILKSIPGVGWLLDKMGFGGDDKNKELEEAEKKKAEELKRAKKEERMAQRVANGSAQLTINGRQATEEERQAYLQKAQDKRINAEIAALEAKQAREEEMMKTTFSQDVGNFLFGEKSSADIAKEIEEEKARIARSQSGENEYWGSEEAGVRDSRAKIEQLEKEMQAQQLRERQKELDDAKASSRGAVVINNAPTTNVSNGRTQAVPLPVNMSEPDRQVAMQTSIAW